MQRVLIIDDEYAVAQSLQFMLQTLGLTAVIETNPQQALQNLTQLDPDLILTDLRMGKYSGQDFLRDLQTKQHHTKVVMMSAYGSLDTAQAALAWGADDYLAKPINMDDLRRLLTQLNQQQITFVDIAQSQAKDTPHFGRLIGQSATMRQLFKLIERVAPFPTSILIQGESGVGKELVAQEIHARSQRANKPFIAVNCAAIPETLLESELFGYKKGAFTGAERDKEGLIIAANHGTLFLDEIGDLPLSLQVKLLRVIQEGTVQPLGAQKPIAVDIRWIAASLKDLEKEVEAGRFRHDLWFRIHVLQLDIPPLRSRIDDLAPLLGNILAMLNTRYGKNITHIDKQAFHRFQQYNWPGNIRQLENIVERAYILSNSNTITLEAIADLLTPFDNKEKKSSSSPYVDVQTLTNLSIKHATHDLEILLISEALKRTQGNRTHAAKLLELSHRALLYKIKEYGL